MFFQKVAAWIFGYVVISIRGQHIERLINMAISRGIILWDLVWVSDQELLAKIRLSGFRPLRFIAKRTGTRFSLVSRRGLPFRMAFLKKRQVLPIGALIFIIALYTLSSFVWSVDIEGEVDVSKNSIQKVLQQEGVKPGKYKGDIDIKALEKKLVLEVPEISWAAVELRGTKLIVKVVEKTLVKDKERDDPAHVVAKKKGLVTEVLVLQGMPMVEEGETVRKGQILISGEVYPEGGPFVEPDEESKPVQPTWVSARGMVKAKVWYQIYAEQDLEEKGVKESGKQVERISIKWLGKELIIRGPKNIGFNKYDLKKHERPLFQSRNFSLPIEVIQSTYTELVPYANKWTRDEALKLARDKAKSEVNKILPPKGKILKQEVRILDTNEPVARVELVAEILEDIGEVQFLK